MTEKISVIIPVFNAEKTLEACVWSVTEQDWQETEILLIDDGSTDGTIRLAEELSGKDPTIRFLRQEHGGASRARNLGLAEASGDCILFLDADDQLVKGAMATLSGGLTEEVDACCGTILRGKEKETGRTEASAVLTGDELLNEALSKPTELLTIHGWLFRKSVFTEKGIEFDPELRLGEDSEAVLRYLGACRSARLIPEAVYRYAIDPGSTIHGWKKGQTDSYLKTLEAIQRTDAGQKKNWPLYVLTTLLLILTHDTFHPANPARRKAQFKEAKRLRALPIMDEAFRKADFSALDRKPRQALTWLKNGRILPAWIAVKIRQRQNARQA